MAGTIPFFLYRTGSPPATGSVRSMFAFWMGGATALAFTPQPEQPEQDGGGGRPRFGSPFDLAALRRREELLDRLRTEHRQGIRDSVIDSLNADDDTIALLLLLSI